MPITGLILALTVTIDTPSPDAEKDFRYHLEKMGAAANVTLATAAHPYAVKGAADETFRLRIADGGAWVSGRTAEAVSHGLYELLERMGCDWVAPGEIGEVIPACADPKPADCDIEESPSFRVRCPWLGGSPNKLKTERANYDLWKRRKKMHVDRYGHDPYVMVGGHAWSSLVRKNRKEFEAHPEMYALVRKADGSFKREGPQIETTNPRVLELAEQFIRDMFTEKKWPKDKQVCISVGPADGGGYSESAESQAIASGRIDPTTGARDQIDTMILFCNRLLERLGGEYPNLRLGFYLYSWHAGFPTRYKPDPRIVVVIADISYSRLHSTSEPIATRRYYDRILKQWAETPNLKFFRGYNWNLAENFLPYSKLRMWADDIPRYHAMNVQGVYNESTMCWGTLGPSNYYEAEILWDVTRDWRDCLAKFCRAAYGKGAPLMIDYYTRITERQSSAKCEAGSFHSFHIIYDRAFVESAQGLFAKAESAAESAVEKERIRRARFPLDQLGEFLRLRELQFAFRFTEADALLKDILAARQKAFDEHPDWIGGGSTRMLNRFFTKPLEESVKYTTAPYRLVTALPDELPTGFDPYDAGADMAFADPAFEDSRWNTTKTFSTPWSPQGLSDFVYGSVWYRVHLKDIPEGPVGLLIGGCDSVARIYLNGSFVGEGHGFAKPFAFDLTDFVRRNGDDVLAIQIQRPGNSEAGTGGILYPSFVFSGPRLAERAPKIDTSERLLPGGAVEKVGRTR